MILATLICTTFYSTSYPFIHKQIMYYASDNLIALSQIINCVSIVLFGFIWNKTKRLFNFYPALCIIEGMLSIGSTIFAITTHNIVAYYISAESPHLQVWDGQHKNIKNNVYVDIENIHILHSSQPTIFYCIYMYFILSYCTCNPRKYVI